MSATPSSTSGPTKVVVAALDGKRHKGFVFNFSALRDRFSLFPTEHARPQDGQELELRKLKAIFFVKEFEGLGDSPPEPTTTAHHGREIEVFFTDGEHMTGLTEGYNPTRPGFFILPADPTGNILRVFVVNANVKQVRWVKKPGT